VFVLCTDNPAALLPTVRSRCVELRSFSGDTNIDDDNAESEGLKELAFDFIEALTGNNVKLMECMFRIDKLDRHAFHDFLSLAREQIVLALRDSSNASVSGKSKVLIQADSVLIKAGEMLDLNVSAGHIAGFICASVVKV